MTTIHPDCQMPDGAEPCAGFKELLADRDKQLEMLGRAIISLPPVLRQADPAPAVFAMRLALEAIAKQKLTGEMHPEDFENADFEGGYDTIIKMAREAVGVHG